MLKRLVSSNKHDQGFSIVLMNPRPSTKRTPNRQPIEPAKAKLVPVSVSQPPATLAPIPDSKVPPEAKRGSKVKKPGKTPKCQAATAPTVPANSGPWSLIAAIEAHRGLMSAKELAVILGKSTFTVYRRAKRKVIPSF